MIRNAVVAIPVALTLMMTSGMATAQQAQNRTQDQNPTVEEQLSQAEKQLEAAVQMMLLALRGVIASIPQYQTPEVLENGDIIIRRAPPAGTPAPEPKTTPSESGGGVKL